MSVRFILGRAGSGKTHHSLESVRRELRTDPVAGPRLILLVPEQAALQTERALLTPDLGAAHRAEVLSFRRLAFRILETGDATPRRALSEPARAMVLRHLLGAARGRLRYYRRAERSAGFIDRVSNTITELIQEAVAPADLTIDTNHPGDDDPRRADKLHDLSLLYAAYLDFLGTQLVDPSQYLELAAAQMVHQFWLAGSVVHVDGFATLSRRESLLLLELARIARSVEISVLLDGNLVDAQNRRASRSAARLFHKTHRTYLELHEAFVRAGLEVEAPLWLRAATPPRFAPGSNLQVLEHSLFDESAPVPEEQAATAPANLFALALHSALAPHSALAVEPGSDFELVQWPTRRLEVQYAVSCIRRWVDDSARPWRYRDIAILVRDLEPYHDLLAAALTAHGIPYFIDRRRPIAHHPLIELLRCGAMLVHEDFTPDAVRLLLKTGLLPLAPAEADELENYIIAHAVAGKDAWTGGDWVHYRRASFVSRTTESAAPDQAALRRINDLRRRFLAALGPLVEADAAAAPNGIQWSMTFRHWVDHLQIAPTLERWAGAAEATGDLDLAAQHRQVWRDVSEFLGDLASALADTPLPVEDIGAVLEQGLGQLTLGLAPPMLDQVLVGAVERSRQPDLQGVILLGFNDGLFPRPATDDAILNDDDRVALRARGLHVAPPARRQTLDESLLVYIAITRAAQRLVVTWAATDEDGRELRASPYLTEILRCRPHAQVLRRNDPLRSGEMWDVLSRRDLVPRLAMELRHRPSLIPADPQRRARWNTAYLRALPSLTADRTARRALGALTSPTADRLSPETMRKCAVVAAAPPGPAILSASVSSLESYAACPFQYLATFVLRLRERQEAALAPVDVGQIRHAILEEFLAAVVRDGLNLGALDDQALDHRLQNACAHAARRLTGAGSLAKGRDAHRLTRAQGDLLTLLKGQRQVAQAGAFRPVATELSFGFGAPGLPPLELKLGPNRMLRLRGFIDRVDVARTGNQDLALVIDYKDTRGKRLDYSRVFHGQALQLLTYLLVLRRHGRHIKGIEPLPSGGDLEPAAALYVSLNLPYRRIDQPNVRGDETETESGAIPKPRGIIAFNHRRTFDSAHEGGWSPHYSLHVNKDGGIGFADMSDGVGPQDFAGLLAHVETQLIHWGGSILDGDMAVRPVRMGDYSPCTWCPMRAACRFEMGLDEVRYLDPMSRSDLLSKLETAIAGPQGS